MGFGRNEPDEASAALAGDGDAFALDVLEEGALLRSIDVPEAEIILVDGGHLSFPLQAADHTAKPQLESSRVPVRAM